MSYVLQMLPKNVQNMIQVFLLSYGTKLCQVMKTTLLQMPKEDPDFTLWRLRIRQRNGTFLCKSYSSLAKCELRLQYIFVEKDQMQLENMESWQFEMNLLEYTISAKTLLALFYLIMTNG